MVRRGTKRHLLSLGKGLFYSGSPHLFLDYIVFGRLAPLPAFRRNQSEPLGVVGNYIGAGAPRFKQTTDGRIFWASSCDYPSVFVAPTGPRGAPVVWCYRLDRSLGVYYLASMASCTSQGRFAIMNRAPHRSGWGPYGVWARVKVPLGFTEWHGGRPSVDMDIGCRKWWTRHFGTE